MDLQGKCVLLGVTGGIAAYKMANVASALKKLGADVEVIMTENATHFITPLVFETLTGHKCMVDTFDRDFKFEVTHISLAKKADVVLVAPATANVIAKMAHGIADDMLTTVVLAARCPKLVSPAMNTGMLENPITQDNLRTLEHYGFTVIPSESGVLACKDVGSGRLPKEDVLIEYILHTIARPKDLAGVRIAVTAGPTQEPLDPVRYLTNHSTGKMGYAIARAAREAGAEVTLVSGPVALTTPAGVTRIDVESALQMHEAVMSRVGECDLFIGCAAVADYRPAQVAEQKIKKTGDNDQMQLTLVKNPDIIADVGALSDKPFTVGFAAETVDVEQYALDKLRRKRLDMIAANDVSRAGQGFNADDNALTVFWQGGQAALPLADKERVWLLLRNGQREQAFAAKVQRVFGCKLGLELEPMAQAQHVEFIQCTFARADTWSLWQQRLGKDRPLHSLLDITLLGWGAYWRLARTSPIGFVCILLEKLARWLLSFVPRRVSPDFRAGTPTSQTVKG